MEAEMYVVINEDDYRNNRLENGVVAETYEAAKAVAQFNAKTDQEDYYVMAILNSCEPVRQALKYCSGGKIYSEMTELDITRQGVFTVYPTKFGNPKWTGYEKLKGGDTHI